MHLAPLAHIVQLESIASLGGKCAQVLGLITHLGRPAGSFWNQKRIEGESRNHPTNPRNTASTKREPTRAYYVTRMHFGPVVHSNNCGFGSNIRSTNHGVRSNNTLMRR